MGTGARVAQKRRDDAKHQAARHQERIALMAKAEREAEKAAKEALAGRLSLTNLLKARLFAKLPGLEGLDGNDEPVEVQGPSQRIYGGQAFCCLRPYMWPRRPAIKLVEWAPFDRLILTTILVNCATMVRALPSVECAASRSQRPFPLR